MIRTSDRRAAAVARSWAERRSRIERSLHDGAQQHLLALQIALVEAEVRGRSVEWAEVSADLVERLRCTIDEIVSLADDNDPTGFDAGDIAASIRGLGVASGLDVVDRLDVPAGCRGWERLVFDVCAEALHNAATAGRATQAVVTLTADDEEVHLTVVDNGVGAATFVPGRGLDFLRHRLTAVGGSLVLHGGSDRHAGFEHHAGTTVVATLPSTPAPTERARAAVSEPSRRVLALDRMVSIRLSAGAVLPLRRASALLHDAGTDPLAEVSPLLDAVRAAVDEASENLRGVVRRLRAGSDECAERHGLDELLDDAAMRSRTTCSRTCDVPADLEAVRVVAAVVEEVMFGLGPGADVGVVVRRRSGGHRVRVRFDGTLPVWSVAAMEELTRSVGSELSIGTRSPGSVAGATRVEFEVPCGS